MINVQIHNMTLSSHEMFPWETSSKNKQQLRLATQIIWGRTGSQPRWTIKGTPLITHSHVRPSVLTRSIHSPTPWNLSPKEPLAPTIIMKPALLLLPCLMMCSYLAQMLSLECLLKVQKCLIHKMKGFNSQLYPSKLHSTPINQARTGRAILLVFFKAMKHT